MKPLKQNKIELLAPAGSYEGFEAALGAGADAVYVGGSAFGARAYAKNFDREELLSAIHRAHLLGKKLYLTVNTLLKNLELKDALYDYLAPYYEAGLDGVIVQDFGVFSFIRKNFPGLPLHASTQMTVTGPWGMKFLEKAGAARVVAARELSLEELSRMHQASPIEIEAFIHGALCYSYSGQCLMSSILGGRSGNRGKCAQPCRLPYQTGHTGEPYKGGSSLCPLSLKDINTIEILPQILEAGVTSLKIEGRMKQPGYTAGVTGIYRKYLDKLFAHPKDSYAVEEEDMRYLTSLFSRGGSCTGYYKMQNGPSMMAFTNEKKTGDITPTLMKKTAKIQGHLSLFAGSPAILSVSFGDIEATAMAGEVQAAKSRPMDEQRIRQQMDKLGNTSFEWEELIIDMEPCIFVPVKTLNEVRRDALDALESKIKEAFQRELPGAMMPYPLDVPAKRHDALPFYISCEDEETARALMEQPDIQGMYLPFKVMEKCLALGMEKGISMYLSSPHITRGEIPQAWLSQAEKWLSMGMSGFLVRNLETYALLKERGLEKKCVIDHSIYTWNNEAVSFWEKEGILRNTVPLELNEKEIRHRDNKNSEMLIYGRLPLMLSAQCVQKNRYSCSRREETLFLKDRYQKEFPVACMCNPWKMETTKTSVPCYNIIYNSLPYGLLKERDQVEALGVSSVRLSFTTEKPQEALEIFRDFYNAYRKGASVPGREFTKGHFKRGAE